MLCLEAYAWNTPPRLLLGILSTSPSLLWSLLSVEAGLSSLRGLIPAHAQVPWTEHTSGCQFGLHISASPALCPGPAHPAAALLYHSERRARGSGSCSHCSSGLGESTELWLGDGRAFNLLLFLLRFPPLSQFSFPPMALATPCLPSQTCAHNRKGLGAKGEDGTQFFVVGFY